MLQRVNIKVPLSRLLLVLEVCNVQSTFKGKPYAANLFFGDRFHLGPLLQGQTMVAQHKSADMTLAAPSNIKL